MATQLDRPPPGKGPTKLNRPPPAPAAPAAAPEGPSVWEQLKDPGAALQAADDMARIGVDTLTFGYLDKLLGPEERAKTQAARERAGWAGTAMDVTTAVAATPSLAARAVPAARGAIPTIARWLGYGGEGAAQAALSAHGHDKSTEEIKDDALLGGILGSGGAAVGDAVGSFRARRAAKAGQQYKTAEDVFNAAGKKYEVVDKSGAHYPIKDTDQLLSQLDQSLTDMSATPGLDDRELAAMRKLRADWEGRPITPTELDRVRRWVYKKLIKPDPQNADLGRRMRSEIDTFTGSNNPINPVTGQPDQAVNQALAEGRSLSARGHRAEEIEKASAKATRRAKKSGSALFGGNIENTRRQEFEKLQQRLEDRGVGGYSPQERAGVEGIAEGNLTRNVGRIASAVSPFRGSIPALAQAGLGWMTGGASLPISIGAEALAQIGNRATTREIENLGALVRDPTGRGLQNDPNTVRYWRDLLAQSLIGAGRSGGQ